MLNLDISSGCVCVPIGSGTVTFDAVALPLVLAAMLSPNNRGYAYVSTKALHRVVMEAPPGLEVDHINGDKLDNRRANLRLVTHSKNCQNRTKLNSNNTSGVNGVYWRARIHSWQACISIAGRLKSLGYFKEKDVAIAKRLAAEREHYGLSS